MLRERVAIALERMASSIPTNADQFVAAEEAKNLLAQFQERRNEAARMARTEFSEQQTGLVGRSVSFPAIERAARAMPFVSLRRRRGADSCTRPQQRSRERSTGVRRFTS